MTEIIGLIERFMNLICPRNKSFWLIFFFITIVIISCKTDISTQWCKRNWKENPQGTITRIAFGSCADQNKDQPILDVVVSKSPQLFIYLGDNIYGDSYYIQELRQEYLKLACKPEFQNLISKCKVLATWDDHDYGHNDVGSEYILKEESKQLFLDFWGESNNTERQAHKGIYASYNFGEADQKVKIILLDLRTFRSPLNENETDYLPNSFPDAQMLGNEQWKWLDKELKEPARIRIIGSSTRFATEYDGQETWANFPNEQLKMFDLIKKLKPKELCLFRGIVIMQTLVIEMMYLIYTQYLIILLAP